MTDIYVEFFKSLFYSYYVLRFGDQVQIRLDYCVLIWFFQVRMLYLLTPICNQMHLGDPPSTYVKHSILSSFLKPYFPIPIWTAITLAMTQWTCHSIDIVHTELFTLFF